MILRTALERIAATTMVKQGHEPDREACALCGRWIVVSPGSRLGCAEPCSGAIARAALAAAAPPTPPAEPSPPTTAQRVEAIWKGLHGGNSDPNRCKCAEREKGWYRDTPHRHYETPPFSCARCKCNAYDPAVPEADPSPPVTGMQGVGEGKP